MTAPKKKMPLTQRDKSSLLEGIQKALDLHEAYFECCAWLITEHPQLTHMVRDGKALIAEERRRYLTKQEQDEEFRMT
jgi:hypothetical protein